MVMKECVVCLDEVRAVCVLPCRHFIYCETCADVMRGLPCGMCRGVVEAHASLAEMQQLGVQAIHA